MPPPDLFHGRNPLTLRATSLPGSLSGTGTDYVLENWTGNDLSIVNDNSLRLTGSQVGELRALDDARLTLEDLAPVDEFHIGGRKATVHALAKLSPGAGDPVLDVGCGIGGAARFTAWPTGRRVTGLYLPPAFLAPARVPT